MKSISLSDDGQQPEPTQKHLQTRHQWQLKTSRNSFIHPLILFFFSFCRGKLTFWNKYYLFFFFFPGNPVQKIQKFDQYLGICQLFLMGKSNSNKNKVLPPPTLVRANIPFFTSRNSDNVYQSLTRESSGIAASSRAFPVKRDTYRLYFCYFTVWRMMGGGETTSLQWALTKADEQGWFELCTNRWIMGGSRRVSQKSPGGLGQTLFLLHWKSAAWHTGTPLFTGPALASITFPATTPHHCGN